MTNVVIAILVLAVVVIAAIAIWTITTRQRRRRAGLRDQFGPEFDDYQRCVPAVLPIKL